MNSTPHSKILSIKDLNLMFRTYRYGKDSLRDKFVNIFKKNLFKNQNQETLHVIKNLNLDIHAGERVGILGVNGSGKTTLCRSIANMLTPASGSIEIYGVCRAIFNTTIGVVPQLTGRENAQLLSVLLFPELNSIERDNLVQEALTFSELGDFLDTPFIYYSKGMQARLCLSIISSKACDLLILDEVFDGADIFFQEKISNRVLKMMKDSKAVLLVSHNYPQIRKACNKVIVIHGGVVAFSGSVEEGIQFYENLNLNKTL